MAEILFLMKFFKQAIALFNNLLLQLLGLNLS